MNILLVYAHHEPTSLTSALKNVAMQDLTVQGHQVITSDLYGQGFSPVAQKWDFVTTTGKHFSYQLEQKHAANLGMSFAPDITGEIDKLKAADVVMFFYPIWWFSVPALLKGWFDRVLAMGVAWDEGKVYEQGLMRGKQAILVAVGGHSPTDFKEEGSDQQDILRSLWPIHHGTLAYCGFDVHEPFTALNITHADRAECEKVLAEFRFRVEHLISSPNWLIRY